MTNPTCPMCETPFTPPKSAPNKSFCSTTCRAGFHNGCRVIGQRLYEDGAISIELIRAAIGLNGASEAVNGDLRREGEAS